LGETTTSAPDLPIHRIIYAGGGGSSKSGVGNVIIAADLSYSGLSELCQLDTGFELCSSVCVSRRKSLLVATFGGRFRLCGLDGLRRGSNRLKQIAIASENHRSDFNDSINACTINCESDVLAVGGDDGILRLWALTGEVKGRLQCKLVRTCLPGHKEPITDCSFSDIGHLVATSSKDGTCRVWSFSNGTAVCVVPARDALPFCQYGGKLIVRACKFIGNDRLVSIQSGSRGSSFAARWDLATSRDSNVPLNVTIAAQRRISRHPVSAVSLGDGFLVCGDVEGLIGFASVNDLAPLGLRARVHELPVTALIVATSNSVDGVLPCAFSVSADYRIVAMSLASTRTNTMSVFTCIAVVALIAALFCLASW